MKQPLLSIVIPTKDRYIYLKQLIDYICRNIFSEQVELVIQDNTVDNTEIEEFLRSCSYPNLKYFHTVENLSIIENSDLAVLHSTGEYVCYIGDDDCFIPSLLTVTKEFKKKNVEAGIFPRPMYYWPDVCGSFSTRLTTSYIKPVTFAWKRINPLTELYKVITLGGQTLGLMPHLYHGVVKRECLNRLFTQFSTFFPGPSPDMANAVALSLSLKKVYYVDYPFIIAGTSFLRIKGNEKGDRQKLESVKFLPKDTIINWCPDIPQIWTVSTIYAQTLYYTLKKFHREDLFENFNWNRLYSNLGAIHWDLFVQNFKGSLIEYLKISVNILHMRLKRKVVLRLKKQYFSLRGFIKVQGSMKTVKDYTLNLEKAIGKYIEK